MLNEPGMCIPTHACIYRYIDIAEYQTLPAMDARLIRNNGYTLEGSDVAWRVGKRMMEQETVRAEERIEGKIEQDLSVDAKQTKRRGHMQAHVSSNSDHHPPVWTPPQIKGIPLLLLFPLPLQLLLPTGGGLILRLKTNVLQLKSQDKPWRPVRPDRWHYQPRHLCKDVGVT